MTKRDNRTLVNSGQYFVRTLDGPLEPTGPGIPDVVICRRVEDFPNAEVPEGGIVTVCQDCQATIVTNLAKYPDRPRICMQCARIQPLPIETPNG
jgi:hypothetical protein